MSCLAGIGGRVKSHLFKAEKAERILVVDGCPLSCAANTLQHAGIEKFEHLELHKIGILKGSCPISDEYIAAGVEAAKRIILSDQNADEQLRRAAVGQVNFWIGRSADNIQVTVKDGVVTLRGFVPAYAEKMECLETVQRIGGAKGVVDEVVVKVPETRRRTDAEIAAAAANAIRWTTTVPSDSINISARAGKLILEGMVENGWQRSAVECAVRHVPGITELANSISTKPQAMQSDFKTIQSSFERHALLDVYKT